MAAECSFYNAGTAIAVGAAIGSGLTANIWGVLSAAAVASSLQQTAALRGCNYNPDAPWEERPDEDIRDFEGGCVETTSGTIQLRFKQILNNGDEYTGGVTPPIQRLLECRVEEGSTPAGPGWDIFYKGILENGQTIEGDVSSLPASNGERPVGYTILNDGAVCGVDYTEREGIGKDYEVVDGDCVWKFVPRDAYVDANGFTRILWTVTPNNPACGDPYTYWSTQGGPEPVAVDDEGEPVTPPAPERGCDCEHIDDKFADQTTEINQVKDQLNSMTSQLNSMTNQLTDLQERQPPAPEPGTDPWWDEIPEMLGLLVGLGDLINGFYEEIEPEAELSIHGVCEPVNPDDPQQPSTTVILPAEPKSDRILSSIDAIAELLQAQLGYRTPICNGPQPDPPAEGELVSLRFKSSENSPYSNTPIRKLLRYRSQSGAELGAITQYWAGFTWTAGPAIVTHRGATWGVVQVWAVDADEGKRVIRHAGGEAGIDPDQVGRWEVSSSRNPRYGVSLPVKLENIDNGPWITQRDGPSGPPQIAR